MFMNPQLRTTIALKITTWLVAQVFWAIRLEEVRPYSGRWMVNPDKRIVERFLATGTAIWDILINYHINNNDW